MGILVLMAASCQTAARSEAALPSGPPVLVVTLDEYRFDYAQPVPAGRVVFRLLNVGTVSHRPVLLPLDEDVPPIQEQLRGDQRRAASPFAQVLSRPPGSTGTFAVDLVAGQRYAWICFARDADGSPHALKGMASEFRAGGS